MRFYLSLLPLSTHSLMMIIGDDAPKENSVLDSITVLNICVHICIYLLYTIHNIHLIKVATLPAMISHKPEAKMTKHLACKRHTYIVYRAFHTKLTRLKPSLFFCSFNYFIDSQKMTYTNFQLFSQIFLAVMVEIVDLALIVVIDSFKINTINSLIKKRFKE